MENTVYFVHILLYLNILGWVWSVWYDVISCVHLRVRPIPIYRYRYRYPIPIPGYIQTDTDIPQTSHTVTDTRYRYIGMIPIYRYDTDIHADITLKNRYDTGLPIPISQIFPYRTDNRYRVHTDIFHTDTDTGYRYLVSVSVSVSYRVSVELYNLQMVCLWRQLLSGQEDKHICPHKIWV